MVVNFFFKTKSFKFKRALSGQKTSPHFFKKYTKTFINTVLYPRDRIVGRALLSSLHKSLYFKDRGVPSTIWTSNLGERVISKCSPGGSIGSIQLNRGTTSTSYFNKPLAKGSIINSLAKHQFNTVVFLSATSPGSYAVALVDIYTSGILQMFLLPSGQKKLLVSANWLLGRNLDFNKLQRLPKKNGFKEALRFKNRVKIVRGIAKNPVDHPNGGNSNTKGSFRTPWGRVAKYGK